MEMLPDAISGVTILLGGLFLLVCWAVAIRVWRSDPEKYGRNQRAAILVKKYNKGTLSADEEWEFEQLCALGIITLGLGVNKKANEWVTPTRISERAIDDILR